MNRSLKIIASIVLLAALCAVVDVGRAGRVLAGIAPGPAVAASLLFCLVHGVNAAKLRLLMPSRDYRTLLAYTLVAQAYALVLPGQLAGEAVKAYRLGRTSRAEAGGAGGAVSSVIFDKVTAIAGVLLVTLVGILDETTRFGVGLAWGVAGGLTGLLVLGAVLAWEGAHGLSITVLGGARRGWLGPRIDRFFVTWRAHAGHPGVVARSLAYGVASQVLAVAGTWVLGQGLGIALPFTAWCAVIGGMTVVLLAPVTVGGIGLREASLVGLLGLAGVAQERALALALAILAFQAAVAGLGLVADAVMLRER